MEKVIKGLLLGCLPFLLLGHAQMGYAQSLSEQREQVIYSLMSGATKDFTQEEIEEYITSEEIKVIETGGIGSMSTYGLDIDHLTAQSLNVVDYLQSYLTANTTPSDLAELYPSSVDFKRLPAK